MGSKLKTKQRMGSRMLILLCILINMLSSFSSDIYLPALPEICRAMDISEVKATSTITMFIIFYALGTLLGGPLCDKYGRKKLLLIGSLLFAGGSAGCMLAGNINTLITFRIIAGSGAGLLTSNSFAIIHDCYDGEECEKSLSIVQSIASIGPVLAPVLGALILKVAPWQTIFSVLTVLGGVILLLSFVFEESLDDEARLTENIIGTLGRLVVVAKNKSAFYPLMLFALSSFTFLGYVGVSSYIYVGHFGLTEQGYSMIYALAALMAIVGPMIYMKFWLKVDKNKLTKICFGVLLLCGIATVTIGLISPYVFFAIIAVFTFFTAVLRPFSMNIIFAQQEGDAGSVSALYNSVNFILGSIVMTVAAMGSGNIVVHFGLIMIIVAAIELIGWIMLMSSSIPCMGVKK